MANLQEDPARRDTEGDKAFNNAGEANATLGGQVYDFLQITQYADEQNQQFVAALQRTAWQAAHRAFRNQHITNSKYFSAPFRNRSKMFRPKIRSAVRKALAAAASAFFSNADVVDVRAENENNPIAAAAAAVRKELLNYRLDRTSARAGVPWFLMCMGAVLDSQLHGVVWSKQYWEYATATEEHEVEVPTEAPALDEAGAPIFDEMGNPATDTVSTRQRQQKVFVTADRPMVMLVAPENAMVDPASPWWDPAQTSPYLCVRYPMTIDAAKAMMGSEAKKDGLVQWLDVPDAVFSQANSDYINKAVRVERSGGVDRYDNRMGAPDKQQDIVWMIENFIRVAGADYHYWSVGTRAFASRVQPTRVSYPEQYGMRPYQMGYAAIEPHSVAPMSPVEQLLPLQFEINELVNLRLDTAKQALSPIAVVRQGSIFDWKALQHRGGADTTVIVRDPKDLEFTQTPQPSASSYQEMDRLNNDFDELGGQFSASSIQANRQMNETVGGMRLLSGSSNSMAEFDLRVFAETWAEGALRQVVRCQGYYEDDQTILTLCGDRAAAAFARHGVDQITDEDLEGEVTVRVNVGVGAADPMQRLSKLGMGMQAIAQAAMFMDKKPTLNGEEFVKEVMGIIGYNDGDRFITFDDQAGNQPPPEQMVDMLKLQLEQAKLDASTMMNQENNANKLQVTELQGRLAIIGDIVTGLISTRQAAHQQQHEGYMNLSASMGQLAHESVRGMNAEKIAKARGNGASKRPSSSA